MPTNAFTHLPDFPSCHLRKKTTWPACTQNIEPLQSHPQKKLTHFAGYGRRSVASSGIKLVIKCLTWAVSHGWAF